MSESIETHDDQIIVKVGEVEVVNLSSGNGIEGFICEPDIPFARMTASAILDVVQFLTKVAQERMDEDLDEVERETLKHVYRSDSDGGAK